MPQGPSLFEAELERDAPLAHRMRPQSPAEFLGQGHLMGEGRFLAKVGSVKRLPNLILWGPPGCGKTTLARLLAQARDAHWENMSAVTVGVAEVRAVVQAAKDRRRLGRETTLFLDEVHRFNKAQQDVLLPHLEDGTLTLIGATTENPSFALNAALLSRSRVVGLKPLDDEALMAIAQAAWGLPGRGLGLPAELLGAEALKLLVERAGGDARLLLGTLEAAAALRPSLGAPLEEAHVASAAQEAAPYDRAGEQHYDTISAFIKSLRGSDVDAAFFYLARMLNRGEDPRFLARRLVIFASEDIGLADPQALVQATAAMTAVAQIGLPEAQYVLWQATAYLALAPKSDTLKRAGGASLSHEAAHPKGTVPMQLRNAPTKLMKEAGYGKGYQYPHDYPHHWVDEDYWPPEVPKARFFCPSAQGLDPKWGDRQRPFAWHEGAEAPGHREPPPGELPSSPPAARPASASGLQPVEAKAAAPQAQAELGPPAQLAPPAKPATPPPAAAKPKRAVKVEKPAPQQAAEGPGPKAKRAKAAEGPQATNRPARGPSPRRKGHPEGEGL